MVDRLHYYVVDLMSSESPFAIERHCGYTWMLSRNINDHKEMRQTSAEEDDERNTLHCPI
jgi:hypothetical protein